MLRSHTCGEIRLSDKPQHMLKVSPKGTVPILILKDKIIDESIDIINWVNKKNNIFDRDVHIDMHEVTEDIIFLFDNQFKFHLDRYKYSDRFKDSDRNFHRTEFWSAHRTEMSNFCTICRQCFIMILKSSFRI